jgi:leucyl aminopeptidase
MALFGFAENDDGAIPLVLLDKAALGNWLDAQPARVANWLRRNAFAAENGKWQAVPAVDGDIAMVVAGLDPEHDLWALAGLPMSLPEDLVVSFEPVCQADLSALCLGWACGSYGFHHYRAAKRAPAKLVWPEAVNRARVTAMAEAVTMGRDLVNTPAEDMGPLDLADAAERLAEHHGASLDTVVGEGLLAEGYLAVHAVGRASSRLPRLIDLRWGRDDAPKVTLVGKGVCFDTGGLNLKNAAGMERMKKDMGGAACVLAVAGMIMETGLPVRLRVLIPAVDNAVDGNAIRPMDIVTTRKGITIEIGDTDAEGRVILADALAAAVEEEPDLVIDMATLTGAARVAVGPDLPACFGSDNALADDLCRAGGSVDDPLWPFPLITAYRAHMASDLADTSTIADWAFADHIQAALFLQQFVGDGTPWLHIDTFCWNVTDRPGRPKGGEVQGARAVFALLCERYGENGDD